MTAEEIEQALKPKKLTRSLKVAAPNEGKKELDVLLSRSIGVVERKKIAVENIKELGTHEITINLHKEVTAKLNVQVVANTAANN